MNKRNTILALACASMLWASAIPARPGAKGEFRQPDGTVVMLNVYGDEHFNYYQTSDGHIVVAADGKYCYASIDEDGELVISNILAHNPDQRAADELKLVSTLEHENIMQKLCNRPAMPITRANNQDGTGRIMSNFPLTGEVKSLVFLVSFSDLDFTIDDAHTHFHNMLNEEGYNDYGGKGSCRDFYVDASNGKFLPEFDVYGPVKLPETMAYYGGNSGWSHDVNAHKMLLHAGQLLDEEVDFSQYDLDKDGFVDNVFIFYAGASEADGAGEDCVWPHQSSIGLNSDYKFDGVNLNRYACGSEMSLGKPDGIGTFCHEFAHVLGLPDLYNTTDASAAYTPQEYSLMDAGCYNGNGCQPPTLSAFERNALKWLGDDLVEITGPASCRLEHILESNKAYLINTDAENEFFLFENRQLSGWDETLPKNGMLIWHIEYNKTAFNSAILNNNSTHQRVDLVEASGKTGSSTMVKRKYPFPGNAKVTSFTYSGTPSFQSWSGKDLGLPITDIEEKDGVITFNVAGGGEDPASVRDIIAPQGFSWSVIGDVVNVNVEGPITISDISGRIVASGRDSLTSSIEAPGLYIIATSNGSQKVIIK